MDPMAEKYYGAIPYSYSMNNPASLIDPDGRDVDVSQLTDEEHKKALIEFLKTKNGLAFIASYLKKGQSFTIKIGDKNHVYKGGSDGEFANDLLAIGTSRGVGGGSGVVVAGITRTTKPTDREELNEDPYGGTDNKYDVRKMVVEEIWLSSGRGVDEATLTLGHEAFVHAFPDQARLRELRNDLNSGAIQPGTKAYEKRLESISKSGDVDHKNLSQGKSKAFMNYSRQLDAVNNCSR